MPGPSPARGQPFAAPATPVCAVSRGVSWSGAQGDDYAGAPAISADGRQVVSLSSATNLVPGDTNGVYDVFVRDLC